MKPAEFCKDGHENDLVGVIHWSIVLKMLDGQLGCKVVVSEGLCISTCTCIDEACVYVDLAQGLWPTLVHLGPELGAN